MIRPDMMKLDVQGYELTVLEGARKSLEQCQAVILELPFHRFSQSTNIFHEAIFYMVKRGFRPYEIVDVLRRPLDGAMGQCDLLFVKEDHALFADNRWSA